MNRSFILSALAGIAVSCTTNSPSVQVGGDPSGDDRHQWVARERLQPVTRHEVAVAGAQATAFVLNRATSSDHNCNVTFKLGTAQKVGALTTTNSCYEIRNASGTLVSKVSSTFFQGMHDSTNAVQKVWFCGDGKVLIYECWADGSAYHDIVALISPDSNNAYKVRYLALPVFSGFPGMEHGPVPIGIVNDHILFDPHTDLVPPIYKMPISSVPEAPSPLPFPIG